MTVYVPQNQTKRNEQGQIVPRFDLSPAESFGKIKYILSPTAKPFLSGLSDFNPKMLRQLHEGLENFKDGDYLLLIGNPVLIGLTASIAAHYNEGNIELLQWNKNAYFPIIVKDLFLQLDY